MNTELICTKLAEAAALAHAVVHRLLLLLLLLLVLLVVVLLLLEVLELSNRHLRVRMALAQHLPHPGHRLAQQRKALAVPPDLAIEQAFVENRRQRLRVLAP